MRLKNSLLLAATAWIFAPAAHAVDVNADTAVRASVLRDLATRIYAAADEIGQARINHRAMAADVPARLSELRSAFDVAARGKPASLPDDDVISANKARQLAPLLANVDRASRATNEGAASALIPAHLPAAQRASFGAVDARNGGTCDSALGLTVGTERDGRLVGHGEVWFRFEAPGPALYRVSTAATPLDTEIAVYAQCPHSVDAAPLSINDDAFGLAAAAPIDLRKTPGPRWIHVRNLGPAGDVAVVAGSAGTVNGRITDLRSGTAIPNAEVYLFSEAGNYAGSQSVDSNGNYSVSVEPGNYNATADAQYHLGQVWPHGPCRNSFSIQSCDLANASLIAVAANASVTHIDFALDPGALISGRVRERGAETAIGDAQVQIYDSAGQYITGAVVDGAGRYIFRGLSGGTYYLLASSNTHTPQVYDHFDCIATGCSVLSGTPLVVPVDAFVQNVDFDLASLLYVNATINFVDAATTSSAIIVYNSSGTVVLTEYAYPGQSNVIGPLAAGSYYISASSTGHFSQLYNHINCATTCANDFATAILVSVSSGTPAPTLVFDLMPTPTVSGRITDAASGEGLANTTIYAWPTDGYSSNSTSTAADGTYTLSLLSPGSYYLLARSADHHDVAYPNASCSDFAYDLSGCVPGQAQALTIAYGTSNLTHVDMALTKNGSISGTVHFRTPGTSLFPAAGASVTLYDAQGYPFTSTNADNNGVYRFNDLVAGTYFVETIDYRYFGQVYAGQDCPIFNQSCNPTGGSPITLGAGQVTSGIDFDPVANTAIVGRVTDSLTGAGIGGVALDLWSGTDNNLCGSIATDANGYYVLGGYYYYCNGATRKISTDAGSLFIDQVYSGVACPAGPAYLGLCPLSGATLITVPTTQPQPIIATFSLRSSDPLFANGFD
jgi:hypothetical protein